MKYSKGFTLVELMVGIVVGVMVVGSSFVCLSGVNKSYLKTEGSVNMDQSIRGNFDLIMNDIRRAGYEPGDTGGSLGMRIANAHEIEFSYFDDKDDVTKVVRYFVNNSAWGDDVLMRDIDRIEKNGYYNNTSSDPLGAPGSSVFFTYLSHDMTPTTVIEEIRAVNCTLSLTPEQNNLFSYGDPDKGTVVNKITNATSIIACKNLGL